MTPSWWTKAPADMPIPDRLNLGIVAFVVPAALALLWAASHVQPWWAVVGCAVAFSYVLLTNYALLHEAAHGNLHSNTRVNNALGMLTGALFPIPFAMISTTHQGHHLRNRTDHEMFDMYYPTDSRILSFGQWYSILLGLFWPTIPLGAVLFSLCPRFLRARLFTRYRSNAPLIEDMSGRVVRSIRLEVLLIAAFFAAAWWALDLRWQAVLLCYAAFSFQWSTRQYVGHAFTKRDVVEGAHNLRATGLMTWVLLHSEYDLNHHRHPEVSWYYLPRFSVPGEKRPSYARCYWRQWLGPIPANEPAPESLRELPLKVGA